MKTKKLINDPDAVVDEMIEGMLAAHPRHLRRAAGHRRALVAAEARLLERWRAARWALRVAPRPHHRSQPIASALTDTDCRKRVKHGVRLGTDIGRPRRRSDTAFGRGLESIRIR